MHNIKNIHKHLVNSTKPLVTNTLQCRNWFGSETACNIIIVQFTSGVGSGRFLGGAIVGGLLGPFSPQKYLKCSITKSNHLTKTFRGFRLSSQTLTLFGTQQIDLTIIMNLHYILKKNKKICKFSIPIASPYSWVSELCLSPYFLYLLFTYFNLSTYL